MVIEDKEEFEKWFKQAEADFAKIQVLVNSNSFDGAMFYSQQSIEKALKALIIKTKKQLPRIHDLLALSKMANCSKEIIDKCKIINPYYIETRYPDFLGKIPAESFEKEEVKRVLKLTKEVLEWIKKVLY